MRYLGGKARIAKQIVAALRAQGASGYCWEPFCGGLNMTEQLAKQWTQGCASDSHVPLMSTYGALRAGWVPPFQPTREEYAAARLLPDTDPLKAFCGFGCSFGGKWFGGYVVTGTPNNFPGEASRALARQVAATRAWEFRCMSFFDVEPHAADIWIYADPPYAGTTGYVQGAFPHARFWAQCQAWARCGVPVYVSEFACPIPVQQIWSIVRNRGVAASTGTATDRLFRVLP